MDAVVARAEFKSAALDGDAALAVQAVRLGIKGDAAALDAHIRRALEGRAAAFDIDAAGGDVQERIRALDVDALVARAQDQRGLFQAEAVVYVDGVLGRVHRDFAAGDDQLVVYVDAVLIGRRDRETAAAVNGEVVAAEDRAAGVVIEGGLGIFRAARHAVFRARSEGQEDLVRLLDTQARVVGAADVRPVKQ